MWRRTIARVTSVADLLRPRTLFRTLARVDPIADSVRELTSQVETLRIRTERFEAIARLDWEQQDDLADANRLLDRDHIAAHITRAVAAAPLATDPFPHMVVDEWLPPAVYRALLRALPPAVFFADREVTRQRMLVPFSFAPTYSRHVWAFVADQIVGGVLADVVRRKFEAVLRDYLREVCGPHVETLDVPLHPSDGRIMLRRPGYVIAPHRDPKWGLITGLVYLARDGDNEAYGTQLYRVRDDEEAPSDRPFYVDESRCELVRAVPFRQNTLLVFLNSRGAHGASIPTDAKPASLERYVYQFRLGPDTKAIAHLLTLMSPDQRRMWGGAKADKAAASY